MNINQLLDVSARSQSDAVAIAVGTSPVLNYRDLGHRVARLAAALRALPGISAGDRVAVFMGNRPEYIEAMWAIWWAGLVFTPVNAKLHGKEAAYIVAHSGARLCLTDDAHVAALDGHLAPDGTLLDVILVPGLGWQRMLLHDPMDRADAAPDDPAWLFYTSGTTGRPKGATLTHRNLMAMTLRYYADIDQLGPEDTMLHAAPLSHAAGLYSLPAIARASCNLIPDSAGFDSGEVNDLLNRWNNVSFFAAPTMLTRLVDAPTAGTARFDRIRTIMYGGAPMYLADLKRALDVIGPRVCQLYAQGESPCTGTIVPKAMHADRDHPLFEARMASVGMARTGVEVRVVDEADRPLPPGRIGEVLLRSDTTMRGYWNNPEATAETLRGGWLHTGDLGEMDAQGFLTLRDRSKDVIISGGSNIYPREVEEVLLRHPAVLEVSVVGRHHPDWGEEVVAFVVARPGADIDPRALDALCLSEIARFKRPKDYVVLPELPKSNYGKILKTELRKTFAKPERS